ncbi:MAG: glycosyltransferase family 2 protein [Chitinophagaceae bacterium]|nr:MAG: glycosyltransferase family 2 protein [Chitinophagaceae bacterium]
MPNKFSIVIICCNAAEGIDRTLNSIRGLSNDVVIYDSGSTDSTIRVAEDMGFTVHRGPWLGFGATRRAATLLAKNDWVFCVDTDEWIGTYLTDELMAWEPEPGTAWRLRLRNHLGKRLIKWGSWGNDYRIRLFNRLEANWNDALIHEKVVPNKKLSIDTLRGSIIHRTARSLREYRRKLESYAELTAESYRAQGRKATLGKRLLSPLVTFCKDYFLKLGFLEGKVGFQLAWLAANYTSKKYQYLSASAARN